jgi:hypothetical protein
MALIEQNLWSNILRGPTDRVGSFLHDLGKPKVNEFEKPIICNHDVFRLEISITDVFIMEILEYRSNLSSIKPIFRRINKKCNRELINKIILIRASYTVCFMLKFPTDLW